jgi:hypothetical protein
MELPVKSLYELKDQIEMYPQSIFGHIRKFDIHTGLDIYTDTDIEVTNLKNGVVYQMGLFTGPEAGSPWWNTTSYVVIKSESLFILYGEIEVQNVKIGQEIVKGQTLGKVIPVLKTYKKNPINMLHLECYSRYESPAVWSLGSDKPVDLLNPLSILVGP